MNELVNHPTVFLVVLAVVLIVFVIAVVAVSMARFYRRCGADEALVRTGSGRNKVVIGGGVTVYPILHQLLRVSLRSIKLSVERSGRNALVELSPVVGNDFPMRVLFSAHACISFMRRRASSKSSAGVFCVFLMNPCTTPIRSSCTKNSNRATRRLGSALRTSQSPWPSGRHSGIPTGHPHCTVARSVPITRRSAATGTFHSLRRECIIKSTSRARLLYRPGRQGFSGDEDPGSPRAYGEADSRRISGGVMDPPEPSTPTSAGCASAKSQRRGLNCSLRVRIRESDLAGPSPSAGLPIAQDRFPLAFDGRRSL